MKCSLCQGEFLYSSNGESERNQTQSASSNFGEGETAIPVWLIWFCIAAGHLLALIIFSMLWTPIPATIFVVFVSLIELAVWQHKAVAAFLTQVSQNPNTKRAVRKLQQEIKQFAQPPTPKQSTEPPIQAELATHKSDLVEVQSANRPPRRTDTVTFPPQQRNRPGMWSNLQGEPLRTDVPNGTIYFYGEGTQLDLGRGVVKQPLIYVTSNSAKGAFDASLLDTTLPVAPLGSVVEERLPYWPNYYDCSPSQRSAYVSWLLGGRTDPQMELGYVFIYFYGLERRVLIDQMDHLPVVEEVIRLLPIYDHSNSFRNYATKFLWLSLYLASKQQQIPSDLLNRAMQVTHRWEDDTIRHYLAIQIETDKALPVEFAFVVAKHDARTTSSVIVRRHGDKFCELFKEKFELVFKVGFKLRSSKNPKRLRYFPASGTPHIYDELESKLPQQPDVLRITSQFKPLVRMWDECIDELKAYNREHRKSDGEMTAEAYESLPESLREDDHPELDDWLALWERYANDDGWSVVPVSEIATLKSIDPRATLTKTQCNKILTSADAIGIGVEPDARLTGKSYKWDQPVCFFFLESTEPDDTSAYNAASALLRLGLNIAEADGHIDQVELDHIAMHLEGQFNLSESQSIRLKQLEYLLINYEGVDNSIGKFLSKRLTTDQCRMIGEFLVGVAAADEVIEPSEIKALKKAWRSLGIDESGLDTLLEQYATEIPVGGNQPAQPASTKSAETEFHLDMQAVSRIMSETQQVATILQQAMSVDEDAEMEPEVDDSPQPPVAPPTALSRDERDLTSSLPVRFEPFFNAVIDREEWSAADLKSLASEHGVMLNGAVEAINEWSTDEFGDWLINEGDTYSIQRELLTQK